MYPYTFLSSAFLLDSDCRAVGSIMRHIKVNSSKHEKASSLHVSLCITPQEYREELHMCELCFYMGLM